MPRSQLGGLHLNPIIAIYFMSRGLVKCSVSPPRQ